MMNKKGKDNENDPVRHHQSVKSSPNVMFSPAKRGRAYSPARRRKYSLELDSSTIDELRKIHKQQVEEEEKEENMKKLTDYGVRLMVQLKKMKKKNKEQKKRISEFEHENERLQSLVESNRSVEDDLHETRQQKHDLEVEKLRLEDLVTQIKRNLESKSSEYTRKHQISVHLKHENRKSVEIVKKLTNENQSLSLENEILKKKSTQNSSFRPKKLENEVKLLKQNNQKLEIEKYELEKQVAAIGTRNEELTFELRRSRKMFSNLEENHQNFKQEAHKRENDLLSKLKSLQHINSVYNKRNSEMRQKMTEMMMDMENQEEIEIVKNILVEDFSSDNEKEEEKNEGKKSYAMNMAAYCTMFTSGLLSGFASKQMYKYFTRK